MEEEILGMNRNTSSSKVLSSSYNYSHTYELEYSLCVIILTDELEYSLYVMRLAYMTLCLTIYITYIIGIRAKLRWQFIVPLGVLKSFTCRSVGSESRRDLGSLVTALSVPCNPHVCLGCRSLKCYIRLLVDRYLVVSRPASHLALKLIM
jgi:hypothetical protein